MSLLKVAGTAATSEQIYVDSVFSTWLYTGNGSTQTITNGIDLSTDGGLVWTKCRDADSHYFNDSSRNYFDAYLSSNSTSGENILNMIDPLNNGFIIKVVNTSSLPFVSWTFRKAAKFFDVQTISHTNGTANNIDLSVLGTVGTVIAKITTTTGNWCVWHRSLTAGNNLVLNTTAAQSTTNAYLSVSGTTATLSASAPTGTYVIYAWAHDTTSAGIIQCGSYTAAASAPNVTLGWEPQYIMVKNTTGAQDWMVIDTMRGMTVSSGSNVLRPNTSAAEQAYVNSLISPNATGFIGNYGNNVGDNIVYIAIRRPNKPPTSGTQVYNGITYTGDGVSRVITTDITTDLNITGRRSGFGGFTETRLTGSMYMQTITSNSEANGSTYGLTSWANNTGYTIGTDSGWNGNGFGSYISWNFKRAPTFFDVVCYTGTGSATTQAHNLGVVPELMIVKERSAANDWWVYDSTDGNTKYSVLNSTAIPVTSSTAWNNTTPTSSVFSIGTGANVNASSQTYVAYLFATLAGISKVGSYTGNGTTQTINCGFSTGARFVLLKRVDSTGDWYTFDTARGMTTLTDPYLLLNSTAAETATLGAVTTTSVGFALNSAILAAINVSGGSYIYLSVA